MTDQASASQAVLSRGLPAATETRRPFMAPAVEELGRLHTLTQFQISVPLPP